MALASSAPLGKTRATIVLRLDAERGARGSRAANDPVLGGRQRDATLANAMQIFSSARRRVDRVGARARLAVGTERA